MFSHKSYEGVSKILSGTVSRLLMSPANTHAHAHAHACLALYGREPTLFPLFNGRKRLLLYRFSSLMHRKSNLPSLLIRLSHLFAMGRTSSLSLSFLAQSWKIHRPNHWWLLTPRCAMSLHEQKREYKKKKYQNERKRGWEEQRNIFFGVAHEQEQFPHSLLQSFVFHMPRSRFPSLASKRPDLPFPSRIITVQVLVQVAARAVVVAVAVVVVEPVQLQE